tara:strand:+ start:760 stop:876 length:117 start_codon:yes stop_codon:yes gene_type:complete
MSQTKSARAGGHSGVTDAMAKALFMAWVEVEVQVQAVS